MSEHVVRVTLDLVVEDAPSLREAWLQVDQAFRDNYASGDETLRLGGEEFLIYDIDMGAMPKEDNHA